MNAQSLMPCKNCGQGESFRITKSAEIQCAICGHGPFLRSVWNSPAPPAPAPVAELTREELLWVWERLSNDGSIDHDFTSKLCKAVNMAPRSLTQSAPDVEGEISETFTKAREALMSLQVLTALMEPASMALRVNGLLSPIVDALSLEHLRSLKPTPTVSSTKMREALEKIVKIFYATTGKDGEKGGEQVFKIALAALASAKGEGVEK